MSRKHLTPATLTLCLSMGAATSAAADGNPFVLQPLSEGYQVADASGAGKKSAARQRRAAVADKGDQATPDKKKKCKGAEAKCGEAKCGGNNC